MLDMSWTKNLEKPFIFKEDLDGRRETVYLYTCIAVGKHIDGHWKVFGYFHNNQGKRPEVIPSYFECWNSVPIEHCICFGGYSSYKIKRKKLVLCQNSMMAYRFQSLPNGDPYDNLDRIGKADANNKELQHILRYLHNLGLETYVQCEVQERFWKR